MLHFRVIGFGWFLFGGIGVALCGAEFWRYLQPGSQFFNGAVISTLIGLVFCITAAATGCGLFCFRRWARITGGIIAILFCLYCLSFVLMVGREFGTMWYGASWLGFCFAAYTLFVIWILRPQDRVAHKI